MAGEVRRLEGPETTLPLTAVTPHGRAVRIIGDRVLISEILEVH